MPTFKEQIAADLDVFVNPLEMADEVEIDGTTVPAVFDKRKGSPEGDPGTLITEYELRVKLSDVPLPKAGQEMTINGAVHFVRTAEVEDGLLVVFTQKNES